MEEEEEKFPAGYRFNPTKVELIEQYLKRKISGKPLPSNVIKEVDIYDLQPEVLYKRFPNKRIQSRYFFTKLDKGFKNKRHRDRKVKNGGRWICSIGDKPVIKNSGQNTGAVYKTLTYYESNDKSKKTGWIMTEYRLFRESKQHQPNANLESDWALCEIHYKGNKAKDDEGDDYREEDKIADQHDGQDQQEEGIGKSQIHAMVMIKEPNTSFDCHGDDRIPLSSGGEVQAADASTTYRSDTCYGGGQIPCNGEEVQSACASTSYSFSTSYGDHQTLFNSEVQAANASTSCSFNTFYDGQHIPLGKEEELQAVGASISHSFSTCHALSPIDPDMSCSVITGDTAGLLADSTHHQYDMVMDIHCSSQVPALLCSNGTGADRFLPLLGDSHIVTSSGIEDSSLEKLPVIFAGDWITEKREELEILNHLIQQDFPNLEEDIAWLPLPTKAAPPNNTRLGEKGVSWFNC